MRQLSGIDVNFLSMETSTSVGHVSSLNIYDPAGVPGGAGLEATKQMLLARMDRLAPFRRRLVEVPFGLDLPYWIEDPDFDIDYHVRHHAVPPPGTPQQLGEVVSRIISRPLDRRRPLWELYVIEGYDNGRLIAQLTKVHHATIDGASGALMLAELLDSDPNYRPTEGPFEWSGDSVPTAQEMLARTLREFARRPERVIRTTVRAVRQLAASTGSGGLALLGEALAQPLPGPLGARLRDRARGQRAEEDPVPVLPVISAPRTPFNANISPHRRFAFTTLPLEEAREIRRAYDVTFNDVVMALCSGALRRYLQLHEALPDKPLVAMVPISVRTGEEEDLYQNRVSALFADLATDERDAVRRLRRISKGMAAAKDRFKATPADALMDFTQFAPPALAARAVRLASRLRIADRMNPPFNLVISNVPGPNHPLYAAGARLEHFYPVSTIVDSQGLNMTVQSYNGNLDFGFVADRELVPDLWVIVDLLREAMADLLAAARAESSGTPSPARQPAAARAAGKAPAAKKSAAKKSPAKKVPAKKVPAAKKSPAKKSAAKKAPVKKGPATRKRASAG